MRLPVMILLLFHAFAASAQTAVSIGSVAPHGSAVVDMSKSSRGLLLPRLTQTARLAISNPAEGLIVYDSSTHRMYQYQDGAWRYFANSSTWSKSSAGNYTYSFDSVGLGTASPDVRLEVNGNIRGRTNLLAENNVTAANLLQAEDIIASGNIGVAGNALINGNIVTKGNITTDNASPIVQLKSNGQNKAFMQLSGNDLRMGTNSGNTLGKTIIRMNGTDVISVDTNSTFRVLTATGGDMRIGVKLMRFTNGSDNMIPVAYGKVYDNNNGAWLSESGTITRTSTGVYAITPYAARAGARSSIVVTPQGSQPLAASAVESAYNITVYITNALTGAPVNADFSFIIMDPRNLLNE